MSKPLTEPKILKKLNIVDFSHLTKDHIIKLGPMLDKMDPEVAKKILEQFPHFSSAIKEMVSECKDTLNKIFEANRESVQPYYDACNSILNSLEKQLEIENLSFEGRMCIINKKMEVLTMMNEKDSENKQFLTTMAKIGLVVVGVAAVTLLLALGGGTEDD